MKVDMIGYKTERLTVIEYAGHKGSKSLWKCQCKCGNICYHTTTELRVNSPASCGCKQKEVAKELVLNANSKRIISNGSCLNSYNDQIGANNTSGVKGVSWFKKSSKWRSQITYNYKVYHLGLYSNINDAISSRKSADEFIKEHFEEPSIIREYLSDFKP